MKTKTFLILFFICILMVVLPNTVLAANSLGTKTDYNGTVYELFDDKTAKIISIPEGTMSMVTNTLSTTIDSVFMDDNGEQYTVTSIDAEALNNITEKQDLILYSTTAPKLETQDSDKFFANINAIYIPLLDNIEYPEFNAKGYIKENGWPEEKLKNYVIHTQPAATTEVTAGNITSKDTLNTAGSPVAAGGSVVYWWYNCDQEGNILDKNGNKMSENDIIKDEENFIVNDYTLQIPKDLTYDNENNTSKDYYFRCVVGVKGNILEYSNIAKVTVKPGAYKVSFNYSTYLEKVPAPVAIAVNNKRQLNKSDLKKIPSETKLSKYKEGQEFIGWTIDGENVIDIDEIATTVFEKNTYFYPLWKTKVNFDANGGKFADGSTIFTTYISNFEKFDKEIIYPTLKGDEFIAYFDKKIGGNIYEGDRVLEETTFYAHWKIYTPKEENNDKTNKDDTTENKTNNPPTGDNIILYIATFIVSVLGISAIIINKKQNN